MDRRTLLALLPALPAGLRGALTAFPGRSAAVSGQGRGREHAARRGPERGVAAGLQRVEALVLGTAQDGGVPQLNCFRDHCARVRAGQAPAPRVACLGLVDATAGRRFLIDATPDLPAQLADLLQAVPAADVAGRTVPLHEHLHGILLTHAHVGHYLGLASLGKEVAAARELPVWTSASMSAFLRANAPWSLLVEAGHIVLRELQPGVTVRLSPALEVTPLQVVHRQELSDTLGYLMRGPARSLLYVPDADTWDGWPRPFEQILAAADVALLDGSFYSADELGHRAQGDVPHPPVVSTVERVGGLAGRPPVWFIHLNHTNPLWDPAAPQRDTLPAGFDVAHTGQRFAL